MSFEFIGMVNILLNFGPFIMVSFKMNLKDITLTRWNLVESRILNPNYCISSEEYTRNKFMYNHLYLFWKFSFAMVIAKASAKKTGKARRTIATTPKSSCLYPK